jgi:hypothetical protein
MKKVMITIFLILINLNLTAPATSYCYITVGEVYRSSDIPYLTFVKNYFKIPQPFLKSQIQSESNFNPRAVNPYSGARGILQYMEIMIEEANKIFKIMHPQNQVLNPKPEYTWNDAFDPYKSIEMYWLVQNYKNPDYLYDRACRLWFGTGRQYDGKTWCDYFNEVIKNI